MNKRNLSLFIVILLAGCTGTMGGMLRDSGERVSFSYKMQFNDDALFVTLPDGEHFEGKAVMVGNTKSTEYRSGNSTSKSTSGEKTRERSAERSVVDTSTSTFQATLFGDRKHTMSCKLHYADTSGVIASGGIGVCEVSDGRVVDLQW